MAIHDLKIVLVQRENAQGIKDERGAYFRYHVSGSVSPIDGAQAPFFKIRFTQMYSKLVTTEALPTDSNLIDMDYVKWGTFGFGMLQLQATDGAQTALSVGAFMTPGYADIELHKHYVLMHTPILLDEIRYSDGPDANDPTRLTTKAYVDSMAVRQNLLDNPWFTVNQRGKAVYTGANIYTADRWKTTGDTGAEAKVAISGSGPDLGAVEGNCILSQYTDLYKRLRGKTVTYSVMLMGGTVASTTGIVPGTPPTDGFITIGSSLDGVIPNGVNCGLYLNSNGQMYVQVGVSTGHDLFVTACKLELGNVSTLANDIAPEYQDELLKCQRYYYRQKIESTGVLLGISVARTSERLRLLIELPTAMRTKPNFSSDVLFRTVGNVPIENISFSIGTSINTKTIRLDASPSGLTAGNAYLIYPMSTGALEFNADL